MKQKYDWEKLMKNKLFMTLLVSMVVVMFSSGVFAYYILSHQSTNEYTISGGISAFGITQDLAPVTIDVSSNLTDTQQIILTNDNSDLDMQYNLTTNINITDPGCSGENDISFELSSDEGVIDNGSNFTMEAGTNTFNFVVTAINDRVCPSIIDVTIDFTE